MIAALLGLRALALPAICALGIAGLTFSALAIRSCESGAAARASLGHYRSALEITRRNGAAALDGAERACEAVRAAEAGHRNRIADLTTTSRSAELRAEDAEQRADRLADEAAKAKTIPATASPQPESELCKPNQPVAW